MFLKKDVDESFYLSEKIVKTFLARNEKNKAKGNGFKFEPAMGDVIASSILTNAGSRDCDNHVYVVGNTNPSGHGMNGNVFNSNGLCPTLTTNKGEGPRILESVPTGFSSKEKKYGNKRVQSLVDSGKISGHEVQFLDGYNQTVSDICGTIKTTIDSSCLSFISVPDFANYRIRKLTPREYFRLMGVSEKYIDNIQKSGIRKTQQYKMAGNSIVVDVLYHIFRKMFVDKKDENKQLSLF